MSQAPPSPILVLGIGNPLMGDEGVGVRVIESLLAEYAFPESVEVVDAGTMGLGMLHLLKNREFVLVVDAVDGTGEAPGTILRLSPEDIAPNQIMHSLHDTKFANVLEAAALTGIDIDAECVGIQIERIEQWVTELTPGVEAAVPAAADVVLSILGDKGVCPCPRREASADARIIRSIRTYDSAD